MTFKDTESGIIPKARLVARGFEEENENIIKESPTCSRDSLRILTAITAQRSWKLSTIDIKTAFLQGEKIERAFTWFHRKKQTQIKFGSSENVCMVFVMLL